MTQFDTRLLVSLSLVACSAATTGGAPPPELPAPAAEPTLRSALPPVPAGFTATEAPVLRTREDIYEQINGASESYLQKGLTDAAFVTWTRASEAAETLDLEVYRFAKPEGAMAQFMELHGQQGRPWHGGSTAIIYEYGVELAAGRVLVRALYSGGPADIMATAAAAAAKVVIDSTGR